MRGRAIVVGGLAAITAACGSGAHTTAATTKPVPVPVPVPTTVAPKPAPRPHPRRKPPPDPGRLPQTHQLPSATRRTFDSQMAALWNGVRHDSVHAAMPAFFPESAYVQVKAFGDPAADWENRLVGEYALDLGAAHALLGSHPERARLLRVIVPSGYAHWVDPGACYNRVGYYEVPNSRVVYRQGEEVRSFGIASMISWRGVWYVVHLGSVSRTAAGGMVDDPSAGAGSPLASSTC